MRKIKLSHIIVVFAFLFSLGFILANSDKGESLKSGDTAYETAVIYKSLTCGCCGVYTSYMKKEGYDVKTENVQDIGSIKRELGVPYELESCHTMEIGGYVVEGHVPEEAVRKLLTEKPDIKGIGMAGMPSGSPGMPGPKTSDFVIYEITREGVRGEIFMII